MRLKAQKILLSFFLLTGLINNSPAFAQQEMQDTLNIIQNKTNNILEDEITKDATDSIKIDVQNQKVFLYGNASIEYQQIKITAGYIEINEHTETIIATSIADSSGKLVGFPVFKDDNQTFNAKEIAYNYITKKCHIVQIITKEGEGYIHGRKVKKNESDIFYIYKGDYTTCDAEKPHYSIRSNRIKVIPKKKIVTGPAYLTFFNIPTPLLFPFGYFPNTNKQSSGILIPSYGESENLGFFLQNGGYYLALNNNMDMTLKGDVYTKGSWAMRSVFRYKKRYKFNGNINLSYGNMINSIKEFPDYSIKKDFFVRWKHQQDPKANPSLQFSANVNAGSSTYHKNNSYNANDYLSNTFTSSISLNKRWDETPFNLTSSLSHSQNTKTQTVNLSVPDIVFNMNRIFPLKKLGKQGKSHWYHKIGVRYTMNTKNTISIEDSLLFTQNALDKFRNGMKHNIPISTSIKVLKHFTLTPRINITERWYTSQIEKQWNASDSTLTTDTLHQFTRGYDYSLSTALNTKIYGLVQFRKGKLAAIRHVITPNLSFTYRPDLSTEQYGFYKTVQADADGTMQSYSIMKNGIFGSPSNRKSGNIGFNLGNILEMKVRSNKDTTESFKKIKILESLNISTAYNIFADSLNLNDISLNARTRLLNFLDITFSSKYDPYIVNKMQNNNLNSFELLTNKRIARFTAASASIGIDISDKTFSKKTEQEKEEKHEQKEDFYKIPWNFSTHYFISYNKGYKSAAFADTVQSLNFSGNIKITPKWKIGFQSGYDFDTKKLSYTSVDIYRDLHCWEMLFHWIPTGFHKSYTLTIRVKASILQDLKLEKKKNWIDPDFN